MVEKLPPQFSDQYQIDKITSSLRGCTQNRQQNAQLKEDEDYQRCSGGSCVHCTQVHGYQGSRANRQCFSCMKYKRFDFFKNYKEGNIICDVCSKSLLKTKRTEKDMIRETGLEFSLQGSDAQSEYMPQVQRGSQFVVAVGQKRPAQETCRNLLGELDFIEEQASVFDEQIDTNTSQYFG